MARTVAAVDLNAAKIESDEGPYLPLADYSVLGGTTEVYFRNLETHLIRHIDAADSVVGCVAWLTNQPILEALARKTAVALVVQKEDFLRPDANAKSGWRDNLHRQYTNLRAEWSRMDGSLADTALYMMSCASSPAIDAVRCVGIRNNSKAAAAPRCHHKFIVFCRDDNFHAPGYVESYGTPRTPYAVWTGSFNFTVNGTHSLENAVVITEPAIVWAYFREWAQVEALSEPLNWFDEWSEPEWRIGT